MVKPEYGAPLVPQPVARTSEEAASPEFQRRLKGAEAKQRIANATAQMQSIATTQSRGLTQSQASTTPSGNREAAAGATAARTIKGAASPAQDTAQGQAKSQREIDHDHGAAHARALLSGDGVASPFQSSPAARPAAPGNVEEQHARGAAAATELVGTPEQQRANRAAQASGRGADGADAAAGAAEARRLLGKE